ncbi:MAG: exosortase system-associated protein, TIGR04073 family [Candidatus Omnitrophota bacterium]|nr:exosortase system-associated protein, TIGR04073 family [Candidatus Omnitrophota bacterium]
MNKLLTVFVAFIIVLSFSILAFAADMPEKTDTKAVKAETKAVKTDATVVKTVTTTGMRPKAYPPGPIQKAQRGFMNAAYGWTEIPLRIVQKTKESNPIKGLILGVFQGSCKAFARTASGLSELATFPIGRYDKPAVLPDMPAAK